MSWTGLPDLWTPFPFPADFLFSCFLSFCPFTHFPILYTHVPCLSISPSVLPISLFCPFPQACLLPIPHFNNSPFFQFPLSTAHFLVYCTFPLCTAYSLLYSFSPFCPLPLSTAHSVHFNSRWYLCTLKSPYALHPVSQKFPQRCL